MPLSQPVIRLELLSKAAARLIPFRLPCAAVAKVFAFSAFIYFHFGIMEWYGWHCHYIGCVFPPTLTSPKEKEFIIIYLIDDDKDVTLPRH